jgi:hypothetical protein
MSRRFFSDFAERKKISNNLSHLQNITSEPRGEFSISAAARGKYF